MLGRRGALQTRFVLVFARLWMSLIGPPQTHYGDVVMEKRREPPDGVEDLRALFQTMFDVVPKDAESCRLFFFLLDHR